jgi:predicted SprT family Zn-dependent metalloprotease
MSENFPDFKCKDCRTVFTTKRTLAAHRLDNHFVKFNCTWKGRLVTEFSKSLFLFLDPADKETITVNKTGEDYTCKRCKRHFGKPSELQSHTRICKGELLQPQGSENEFG